GILADVRNREFYEKPTTIRKRAKASAAKRRAKKQGKDGSRSSGMMAKSR
ncbi:MAG: 30S ribosomal protein S21, partial [Succinivibrionaceae bacterium]|nr:30S ribosomal protein S21 [Succinivibrionaceae bacterium]